RGYPGQLRSRDHARYPKVIPLVTSSYGTPLRDSWPRRIARYLRQWQQRQGRIVSGQMLRGASYSVGSGAVSLIIIWFETRR
ncbi:hypothetical protein ABZ537_51135, partial [Streptomyces umbrinus]